VSRGEGRWAQGADMSCREFVEFLMSYLDGELAADSHRVFEEHMQLCPPCVSFLDTYRDSIRLGKFACQQQQQEVPEVLIQAILAARRA
jgi:predicted anti-sigma-YlaC factor YlaD